MSHTDMDKAAVMEVNEKGVDTPSVTSDSDLTDLTPAEQKKLIRKIDRRIVITLGLLYAVSLMDRNNTGIALIAGMGKDLDFKGFRYSLVVLLFFIPYAFFQPTATVLLRKLGPNRLLAFAAMIWGLTTIAEGFVKTWSDLIPLRLILGTCEAVFFPGCAYLLSCWYPRYDLQKRNAVFYLIGTLAGAFTGILAYGFSMLEGQGHGPTWWSALTKGHKHYGIAGWRWIFILQGVLTCVVAVAAYYAVVNFPDRCGPNEQKRPFLNRQEQAFVLARIENDREDSLPEDFKLAKYLKNALDLKVWAFATLFAGITTVTYAIAYFLPIILTEGMGFNVPTSQCLLTPPYALAAIVMYTMAHFSDKYRIRSPFIIMCNILLLIGLPLLGFSKNVGARYFGAMLSVTGCNAMVPCVLTWQANNIRGQWKRALCSATLVGSGGLGAIIGVTVFRAQDKPTYRPGIFTTIGAACIMITVTLLLVLKFMRANKRAAAGGKIIEGLEGFRYTY